MSLFQPSNITPDVLTGSGVVSASEQMAVSWQVNGLSCLVGFILQFSNNDTNSTPIADTGVLWIDGGFYGTDQNGNPQFFSYDFKKSWHDYNTNFIDGGSYKMKIIQAYLGIVYGRDSIELLNGTKYCFTYQNQYFTFKNEAGRRTVSLYYCPETGVLYEIQKNGNTDEYKFLSYEVTDSKPASATPVSGMVLQTGRNAFVMPYGEAVFDMKTQPGLSISEIPNNTITQPIYTFTGNFEQPQGDIVSFARWIVEDVTDGADNVLFDTGNVNTSLLQFTYNQFFSGRQYKITLMIETDGGQTKNASQTVSVSYNEKTNGIIETQCRADGGVAVRIPNPTSFPAEVTGDAEIKDGKAYLYGEDAQAVWSTENDNEMDLEAPFSGAVKTLLNPLVWENERLEPYETINNISDIAFSPDGHMFAFSAKLPYYYKDRSALYIYSALRSGRYGFMQKISGDYTGNIAFNDDGSKVFWREDNSITVLYRQSNGMYAQENSKYITKSFASIDKMIVPSSTNIAWYGYLVALYANKGLYIILPDYNYKFVSIDNITGVGFLPFEIDGSSLAVSTSSGLFALVLSESKSTVIRQTKIADGIIGNGGVFGFDINVTDGGECYIACQEQTAVRLYNLNSNGTASLYTYVTNENRTKSNTYTDVTIDKYNRILCKWSYSSSSDINYEIYDTGNVIFSGTRFNDVAMSKDGSGNYAAVTGDYNPILDDDYIQTSIFRSYAYKFFEMNDISLHYAGNKIGLSRNYTLSMDLPALPTEVVISILPGGLSVANADGSFTFSASLPAQTGITSITARGNVFDYIYFSSIVPEQAYSFDFVPVFGDATLFLANFTYGFDGGSAAYAYRILRKEGDGMKTAAILPPNTTDFIDYSVPAAAKVSYFAVVSGNDGTAGIMSSSLQVRICLKAYMLYEAKQDSENKNLYHVLHVYRFGNNLDGGDYASSYNPTLQTNFTPYPYVQKGTQNAWSGTLKALLSNFHNGVYTDTAKEMQVLKNLAVTDNALFLKDMKGNFMQIAVSGGITQNINIKSNVQEVTVSIPWVEIGDTSDISLVQF